MLQRSIEGKEEKKPSPINGLLSITLKKNTSSSEFEKICEQIRNTFTPAIEFKRCTFSSSRLEKILISALQNDRIRSWHFDGCLFVSSFNWVIKAVNANKNLWQLKIVRCAGLERNPFKIMNTSLKELVVDNVSYPLIHSDLKLNSLIVSSVAIYNPDFLNAFPTTMKVFKLDNVNINSAHLFCEHNPDQTDHSATRFEQRKWNKAFSDFIFNCKNLKVFELTHLRINDNEREWIFHGWDGTRKRKPEEEDFSWSYQFANSIFNACIDHPSIEAFSLTAGIDYAENKQYLFQSIIDRALKDKHPRLHEKRISQLVDSSSLPKTLCGLIAGYNASFTETKLIEDFNCQYNSPKREESLREKPQEVKLSLHDLKIKFKQFDFSFKKPYHVILKELHHFIQYLVDYQTHHPCDVITLNEDILHGLQIVNKNLTFICDDLPKMKHADEVYDAIVKVADILKKLTMAFQAKYKNQAGMVINLLTQISKAFHKKFPTRIETRSKNSSWLEKQLPMSLMNHLYSYLDAESVCLLLCVSSTFKNHATTDFWKNRCAERKIPISSALTAESFFKNQFKSTFQFVKFSNGKILTLDFNTLTTLADLEKQIIKKAKAAYDMNLEPWELRLIANGKQLAGDETLIYESVKSIDILHCMFRVGSKPVIRGTL